MARELPSDINYRFFIEGSTKGPALLVHKRAVFLNMTAYRLIGEPPGLKIGISKTERCIYVWPEHKAGVKDVIYISEYNRSVSRALITQRQEIRDSLIRLGLEKFNPAVWDGEKLTVKF